MRAGVKRAAPLQSGDWWWIRKRWDLRPGRWLGLTLYVSLGATYRDRNVCMFVCLCVRSHVSKTTRSKLHEIFCACYLWRRLGPPLSDGVTFSYNGSNRPESKTTRLFQFDRWRYRAKSAKVRLHLVMCWMFIYIVYLSIVRHCLCDRRFSRLCRTTCNGQTDTRWQHIPC